MNGLRGACSVFSTARTHSVQRLNLTNNALLHLLTKSCGVSQNSGQQKWPNTTMIQRQTCSSSSICNHIISPPAAVYTPKTGLFHICCRSKSSEEEGLPEISEDDLEETFTRGHGPGGQSVNKTTNCCVLKHVPTGVAVKVHETRSLDQNRKIARLRLRQKLDQFYNGEESKSQIEKRLASARRKEKKKKTNERLEKLKAFKEREGLT